VGAYQSGALSYFGADRLAVVNLDGVVNPHAPSTEHASATARYVADECVRWIADDLFFVLRLTGAVGDDARLGLDAVPAAGVPGNDTVVAQLVPKANVDQPPTCAGRGTG
jgi:hypothetical protein